MTGDADIVRLARDHAGDLRVLIADMKATTTAKVEHRLGQFRDRRQIGAAEQGDGAAIRADRGGRRASRMGASQVPRGRGAYAGATMSALASSTTKCLSVGSRSVSSSLLMRAASNFLAASAEVARNVAINQITIAKAISTPPMPRQSSKAD